MTAPEWSSVTDLFGAVLAERQRKTALLEREPVYIREEVERLLAAHDALEIRQRQPPGRTLRGRYRLESLLGSGGSGEAWLSQDCQTGELVVVKVARYWEWFRADLKQRFQAEVEILGVLQHPGIVRMLDSGETEEGAPFLVMPFVDGLTLRSLLEAGPLTTEAAASVVEQLGEAIAAAHRVNVTHRDIKPENIIVQAQPGGSSRVFLIDFGIALFADLEQQCGTTTRFFGTTQYMAPEQLLGKPVKASDTYALALVTFEMLCGESLLKAQTPVALYDEARCLKESRMGTRLTGSVRALLLQALQVNPGKRPADIAAYSARLAAQIRQPGLRLPSRRSVLGIGIGSALAVPGALWLNSFYGPPSDAEKRVAYKGGQTFTSVGWQRAGRIDEDLVVFDPASGNVIGNSLISAKLGGYFFPFSRRVRRSGLKRRWRAKYLIRPVHGESSFAVCFPEAGLRFIGTATVPDRGTPYVRLIQSYFPVVKDMRAALRLDPGRFLAFELRFDPVKQCASLYIDGRLVLDGYSGTSHYLEVPGLTIGVGTFQSKIGESVFGDIEYLMD